MKNRLCGTLFQGLARSFSRFPSGRAKRAGKQYVEQFKPSLANRRKQMEAAKGRGNSGEVECTFVYQPCLQFGYIQSSGVCSERASCIPLLFSPFSPRNRYPVRAFVIISASNFRVGRNIFTSGLGESVIRKRRRSRLYRNYKTAAQIQRLRGSSI